MTDQSDERSGYGSAVAGNSDVDVGSAGAGSAVVGNSDADAGNTDAGNADVGNAVAAESAGKMSEVAARISA